MPAFLEFKGPGNWGMSRMMERIEYIQERFKIPWPRPVGGEFQQELQNNIGDAAKVTQGKRSELLTEDELFAAGTFPSNGYKWNVDSEDRFEGLIDEAARKYNLDKKLLKAVIKAESNFNPKAVSPKGAMGLMQLMPGTAESLSVTDPFDPAQNIDGGARYLRSMLDMFGGDRTMALSAYNAGPKSVQTYKGIPPYRETQDYVKRISELLNEG